jgi:hypothetical protein
MGCSECEGVRRSRQNRCQWGPRDSVGFSEGQPAGFAGAKPRAQSLDGYLDLQRRVEDPRVRHAAPYTKRLVVHQFPGQRARAAG